MSETLQLTGYYPWAPSHPCFYGHKLVDSDTPMVCDRCGAWLVYHPNGLWRSVDQIESSLVAATDGGGKPESKDTDMDRIGEAGQ